MLLLVLSVPLTSIEWVYLAVLAVLAVYGAHRLWLLVGFRWPTREAAPMGAPADASAEPLPVVTVQLPLYNERTVASRLLRAVGELDYPRELFEVQVLDDSSDETSALVDAQVAALRQRGVDASVLRRPTRAGFKAGALDFGMRSARGELLCVFDADFRPPPGFLRELVPALRDSSVGMVQARWEHENRAASALTRAQSILLDGHFVIEHTVRHARGLFFNFNGTAGLWRRAAIEGAGGWQHDTLTEDLDLSYRAQLAGWRFVYKPLTTAPAEVPPTLAAFQSQQRRWAKGSVQVARKLGGTILRADVPWRVKLEAFLHLTGNAGYPLVLLLAVLLPLTLAVEPRLDGFAHLAGFLLCTCSVILFYDASQRAIGRPLRARLFDIPAAMALGIGMCASQTRAVLEGLFGGTGAFVRTPKQGGAPARLAYRSSARGWPWIELALAAWFGVAIPVALARQLFGVLPFLLLFFAGFAWVAGLALQEARAANA
jgi:cellulose synthase/poly-beta-1,6-N-acetylglucosamine synthase-like glycosyltransferase